MTTYFKKDLDSKYLESAISLWVDSFKDSKQFAKYFLQNYSSNYDYVWTIDNDVVVSMAYIIEKKVLIQGNLTNVYLIVGVSTKTTHLRKGLMNNIINLILEKYKGKYIFMQADHWEYYKNWDFLDVSNIYEYKLDSILSSQVDIDKLLNWSAMNEQFNKQGSIQYDQKSFQEYINMFIIDGAKIASINETYIVFQNNLVLNFAFKDVKTFIDLLHVCKINSIQTHYPIKSRYLLLSNKRKFTKSTSNFENLVFNALF